METVFFSLSLRILYTPSVYLPMLFAFLPRRYVRVQLIMSSNSALPDRLYRKSSLKGNRMRPILISYPDV